MKAYLLYRDRDFDWQWVRDAAEHRELARSGRRQRSEGFNEARGLPWNYADLTADLGLDVLFSAMAKDDDWIFEAARKAVLTATVADLETVLYRQSILRDCLANPDVIRELYLLATEAMKKQRGSYLGILASYPQSVLHHAIEEMAMIMEFLRKLRLVADQRAGQFSSEGWSRFFSMLRSELDDDYMASVQNHLNILKFHNGTLLGAGLGRANKGKDYILHRIPYHRWNLLAWLDELFHEKEPAYTFEIHPRDEAGGRALSELQDRGMGLAANALAQSVDHVRDFFGALRAELAFLLGCINLRGTLEAKGKATCFPRAAGADEKKFSCEDLYEVCLALSTDRPVAGNEVAADGKMLLIVTGRNTGGKSTFLRSVGLAQLMMQAGMFVPARAFSDSLCQGIHTHFKREEDNRMESGKFDEELGRMSDIINHIRPHSLFLSNESFSATNEREGSEIGRQIIAALLAEQVRAICVTHMYELAHGFYKGGSPDSLFLRANREEEGTRSFKLAEGEPLRTSFGEDLYYRFFPEDKTSVPTPENATA